MPLSVPSYRRFIMPNILKSVFIVIFIIFVMSQRGNHVEGKRSYDDITWQMMHTIAQSTETDIGEYNKMGELATLMSKAIQRGRSFHYLKKLHSALQRETERSDKYEDASSQYWTIRASRASDHVNNTIIFKTPKPPCNVTRIELLIPMSKVDLDGKTQVADWINVEVNGYNLSNSGGTVDISRAAVFDLTKVLLNHPHDAWNDVINITAKYKPCMNVHVKRAMLYDYCNINQTILGRFALPRQGGGQGNDVPDPQEEFFVPGIENPILPGFGNNNNTHNDQNDEAKKAFALIDSMGDFGSSSREIMDEIRQGRSVRSVRRSRKVRNPYSAKSRELRPEKKFPPCTSRSQDETVYEISSLKSECQRRPWYVYLHSEARNGDIIIPRDRVDVGSCCGSCANANDFSQINDVITAHAVIFNRLTLASPPVRCSPRKMSSISIMRALFDSGKYKIENIHNAKIESCLCA